MIDQTFGHGEKKNGPQFNFFTILPLTSTILILIFREVLNMPVIINSFLAGLGAITRLFFLLAPLKTLMINE